MSERVFAIYLPSGYLYGFRYKEEDAQQMCDEEDGRTYKELVPIDRIRELEAENKLALVCTKELQGDCIYYSSKLETLITELRDIQTDVHKLNDLLRWNVDGWDAPESIVYAASGLSAKLTALLEKYDV